MKKRALLCAGWLTASLLSSACQSNVDEQIALAALSEICRINSDCSASLICAFERCHQQCASSRDCEAGARCVAGRQGRPVCQLPDEQSCAETGCPGEQLCGVDLQCRDACASARQCVSEQVCSAGTCADVAELDEHGQLEPTPEAAVPCVLDSDCPDLLVCAAGSCSVACTTSSDCRAGFRCSDGACEALPVDLGCLRHSDCPEPQLCLAGECQEPEQEPMPACEYDSDCGVPGQHCAGGECQCECQNDGDCADGQACSDGCQCTANRVLVGDVSVSSDEDLVALKDVVEIQGTLNLFITRSGEFHLPHLRKVTALSVSASALNRFVLDALEEVTGYISCYSDCRAPRLRVAPSMMLNAFEVERWEFPELTSVGTLYMANNAKLVQALLPKLAAAGALHVNTNPLLERVEFPLLRELEQLWSTNNDRLATIDLPLAEPTAMVTITNNWRLSHVSLPSMQAVSGTVDISSDWELSELDISGLTEVGTLTLRYMPKVTSLELGKLKKVDIFNLERTGLTELAGLYPIPPGALQEVGDVFVTWNSELPECTVQDFAQALRDQRSWTGTLTSNDNVACCEGAPCP